MVEGKRNPEPVKAEQIKMGSSDLEQLTRNLSAAEGGFSQDAIVEHLSKNWSNILWGIVGVVAVFGWIVPTFQESRERAKGAAAERFEDLQQDFEKIRFGSTPADDATLRAFEDNIKGIRDIDSRSAYGSYAELYLAAKELGAGNISGAAEKLTPFEPGQLDSVGESERLFLEQALLLKSKVLLSSDTTREQAKELLRSLSKKADIVGGEALLSYTRVFGIDDDLIRTSFGHNPALREKLTPELQKLGWKSES